MEVSHSHKTHSGLELPLLHLGDSIPDVNPDVTVVLVVDGSGPLAVEVVRHPLLAEVAVGTTLREKTTVAIETMSVVIAIAPGAQMIEIAR